MYLFLAECAIIQVDREIFMESILWQATAVIFYVFLFMWIFLKLRNVILVGKYKCRDAYKEIKKDVRMAKTSKHFRQIKTISIIVVSLIALYLWGAIILGGITLFVVFITLGGAAFVDTGADPTWYNNFMSLIATYFSGFKYLVYVIFAIYIIVYIFLALGIDIELNRYRKLIDLNSQK